MKLNKTILTIRLRRGLFANLKKVATNAWEGEPLYPTDKPGRLYIANASYVPMPVQSLDMAVCVDNQVVCNSDEIVFVE